MIKNAVTVLATLSLALHTIVAYGHDWRHPNLDAWYSSLSRPGVSSCCSKNDRHATDAELRSDGSWWARLGEPVDHPDGQRDWVLLDWVPIDDQAIVKGPERQAYTQRRRRTHHLPQYCLGQRWNQDRRPRDQCLLLCHRQSFITVTGPHALQWPKIT
jgi:hypothetical protein